MSVAVLDNVVNVCYDANSVFMLSIAFTSCIRHNNSDLQNSNSDFNGSFLIPHNKIHPYETFLDNVDYFNIF